MIYNRKGGEKRLQILLWSIESHIELPGFFLFVFFKKNGRIKIVFYLFV
jgi:hypothetical protein